MSELNASAALCRRFAVDLDEELKRRSLREPVFCGDQGAHRFEVALTRGGVPFLSGTAAGYLVRGDGVTLVLACTRQGNLLACTLPQEAYAVPGRATLLLRLLSGDALTTVLCVDMLVHPGPTETLTDPGGAVPSLETLLAEIDRIESAAARAEDAVSLAQDAVTLAQDAAKVVDTGRVRATEVEPGRVSLQLGVETGESGGGVTLDQVYPVGAIYLSVAGTNPGTLFGGTWEAIQDRFLLACGKNASSQPGKTGGYSGHQHTMRAALKRTLDYSYGDYSVTVLTGGETQVTDYIDHYPPYLAVYMWKRVA